MKRRTGGLLAVIILIVIIVFLAVGAGFFLYNPDRLALTSAFCAVDVIRGDILVMPADSLTWERASDGMLLEPGSRIKTASDAGAMLTFSQGTTTKLEPGTDLIIDKIEESQDIQTCAVILKQQSGKTWNRVNGDGGNTSFQILTASAAVQVHGTLFSTEVDATGKTTVQTAEGCVSVKAGGAEVQVPAGRLTEVRPGERPDAPSAVPQAKNELVITVLDPALALIKDPSGSSIGYLESGDEINQITGSIISTGGATGRTIRIREPESGEYSLTLHGAADGTGEVSIEGFLWGESAFLHVESCNVTAARETLLKLHYDVIDGLLALGDQSFPAANAALASEISDDNTVREDPTAAGTQPPAQAASDTSEPADSGFSWLGKNQYGLMGRLAGIICLLFIVGAVFFIMRKNS